PDSMVCFQRLFSALARAVEWGRDGMVLMLLTRFLVGPASCWKPLSVTGREMLDSPEPSEKATDYRHEPSR
ncbi:hypothetical protein BaRGS_00003939, partial [Batillaria attramentaria]